MPIDLDKFFSKKFLPGFTAISGLFPDIAVIAEGSGIFYE